MAESSTFPAVLRRDREEYGSGTAVVAEGGAMTYAQLDAASRSMAGRLVAGGIGKAARVGLRLPESIEWVVIAAAVMRVGAVPVPLGRSLRGEELESRLRTAGVTHLVSDDLRLATPAAVEVARTAHRHPQLPFLGSVWPIDRLPATAVDDALVLALEDAVRPADDMVILFTAGNGDEAKGVIHTHSGGLRAVATSLRARGIRAGDRVDAAMPFSCADGFAGGLLTALVGGATLHIETGSDVRALGLAETFGPYCGVPLGVDLPDDKDGSCGQPFDGFEVRITELDSERTCPPGQVGEIRIRSSNMMRGICGRTRDATFDTEGFYPTGDLGMLDADGYLWHHGRLPLREELPA